MPRFRFRILDVMAVIVFAAVILGFKTYLDRESFGPGSAHEPALAVYVALLCTALVGVRSGRARWRPFWGGVAFFGVVYLVVGLHMGWGVTGYAESESLRRRCELALPLAILCRMAAQWLVISRADSDLRQDRQPDVEPDR